LQGHAFSNASSATVPNHNEFDARPAERLDDIEILFTGYAEDPLDAFILQSSDKQVRTLHAPASWHTAQLQLDID